MSAPLQPAIYLDASVIGEALHGDMRSSPLLTRAGELEAAVGFRVFRPADYLARWSTQQRMPG